MATKQELEIELEATKKTRDAALAEVGRLKALAQDDDETRAVLTRRTMALTESRDKVTARVTQLSELPLLENERTALREYYRRQIDLIEKTMKEVSDLQGGTS